CELRGDPQARVDSVGSLSHAGARAVTFLANPKYVEQLKDTRAGAVILDAKAAAHSPVAALVAANPHATYARIATLLHPDPPLNPGVHPQASVESGVRIDPSAEIAAQAYVGEGARIGARCFIGPGCVVERGAIVGDDTRLVARVVIGHHVTLGERCIVQPGAVIGGDGFGFAPEKGAWVKVPQIGGVLVGDDVEIGANTTIDRGALEDTVLEEDVRLDNQIQIGHNAAIGAHTAMAGCAAVAGSARIGRYCLVGGGAGILGHLEVCDRAVITAMSLVTHSIREPGEYSSGTPIMDNRSWRKNAARFRQLDALARRVLAADKD
ncbi:MAG TPA: UDP-3-O-(3-hydroxymyristoyl)glucosamine N-acyltransferase, partial [Lysobacter sp.]|nr:UDP-3-O-(3-hydroxymyristoyl)glucosamine N-acyltransferase [Lysobacter sp.]